MLAAFAAERQTGSGKRQFGCLSGGLAGIKKAGLPAFCGALDALPLAAGNAGDQAAVSLTWALRRLLWRKALFLWDDALCRPCGR